MRTKAIVIGVLSVFLLSVSLLAQITPAQRAEVESTLSRQTGPKQESQPEGQGNSLKVQDDSSRAVRIAIVDSQKAFDLSTEGQKIISLGDSISKKKRQQEIDRIRTEMVVVIDGIAKEKGYSLVFDLATAGIVKYYPPTEDITNELVSKYNSSKRTS
jgi:Skp family chaperone for outer membrane proteins